MSDVNVLPQQTPSLQLMEDTWSGLYLSTDYKPEQSTQVLSEDHLCDIFEKKSVETRFRKHGDNLREVGGILEGPFFKPDGESVNRRFYERKLWENVLTKVTPTFDNTGLLGTFMHPKTDDDSHPGKSSHVLKALWMDDKLGYGKLYILNNPMGEIVRSLASSTDENGKPLMKLATSSRARGELSSRRTSNGIPIVNPDTYMFETFDIVLDPGIREAYPNFYQVVNESVNYFNDVMTDPTKKSFYMNEVYTNKPTDEMTNQTASGGAPDWDVAVNPVGTVEINDNGGNNMDDAVKSKLAEYESMGSISDMAKDKAMLQAYQELGSVAEITELFGKIESLCKEKEELKSENDEMQKELDIAKEVQAIAGGDASESRKIMSELAQYRALGTVKEVTEAVDATTAFFKRNGNRVLIEEKLADYNAYKKLGTIDEINKVCEAVENFTKTYGKFNEVAKLVNLTESFFKEYGTFNEAKKVINMTESFMKEYGSFDEAKKVINLTESFFKEYGSFDEAKKVINMTESFIKKNGTFGQINEAMDKFQVMVNKAYISEQAKKFGVPESFVQSLLGRNKNDLKAVEESLQVVSNQIKAQLNESRQSTPVTTKPVAKAQRKAEPIKLEESREVPTNSGVSRLRSLADKVVAHQIKPVTKNSTALFTTLNRTY